MDAEFVLELLKEERKRRQLAEEEVKVLQSLLEPFQQKELDRISKAREASLRRLNPSAETELGTYVRNKFPAESYGKLVCDCGDSDHHRTGIDEVD